MRSHLSFFRSRTLALLAVCGLALTQAACAHPVVVEPSVVVQARMGGPVYGSVYAPLYGSPSVVVTAPPPVWVAPPPRVWMAPSAVVMPPAWGPPRHRHWHGQGVGRGWGRGEGFHR